MTKLPTKPDAVAHVSDQHWEDALDASENFWSVWDNKTIEGKKRLDRIIDHARCLILLGEVAEPIDPIEDALESLWQQVSPDFKNYEAPYFKAACRKHFACLTFPEAP